MVKLILDKDVFNVRFIEESVRELTEWFNVSSLRLERSFTSRGFESYTLWEFNEKKNSLIII